MFAMCKDWARSLRRVIEVILPVLDEARAIPAVLSGIPSGFAPLVVDNGSRDGSADVARRRGATVVHEPRRGFGAACFAGLLAARSDVVCFMDCDGSLDPRELPRVVGPVAGGEADLCLGARVAAPGAWPWHGRAANRLLALELRRRHGIAADRPRTDAGRPARASAGAGAARPRLRMAARDGAGRGRPGMARDRGGGRVFTADGRSLEGDRERARHPARRTRHERPAAMSTAAIIRPADERRAALAAAAGWAALTAAVSASAWLAVGAAQGRYLLQLPTKANPDWIGGPLRGLEGPLGPSTLSLGLIVLCGGYLVALACAEWISLPSALGAVALVNLAFTLGPTIVSTDVFGYIAYGREFAARGLDPYVSAPISLPHDAILPYVYWKHQTSPYGPLFTILGAPLGLLSPSAALWSYKAVAGASSVALSFVVADVARRRALNPARAAMFVGLNPVLLFYAVSGAHNDLFAALLVIVAIALALRGRESAAAAGAVAAAAIKLTFGLALPFVVAAGRRRGAAVRGATLAASGIAVPTLLLFGPHIADQLRRIVTDGRFDIAFSGPDRLAVALGTRIDTYLRGFCVAGAGLVALIMIARAWRGHDPSAAAGWAFLALLVSIASLAPWYLVWLLPLAAVARNRALQGVAMVATLYLVAVHLPALHHQPWLSSTRP